MSKNRLAFTGVILIFAVLGLAIIGINRPPSTRPTVTLTVLGYTNVTDYSSHAFHQGEWIRAQLAMTNEGNMSVSYTDTGDGRTPGGWIKAQTKSGWTNGPLSWHLSPVFVLVRPKASITFSAWLPAGTLRWQCGFGIRTASLKERLAWRSFENRWWNRIGPIGWWVIKQLPNKTGPEQEFKSDEYEVIFDLIKPQARLIDMQNAQVPIANHEPWHDDRQRIVMRRTTQNDSE